MQHRQVRYQGLLLFCLQSDILLVDNIFKMKRRDDKMKKKLSDCLRKAAAKSRPIIQLRLLV